LKELDEIDRRILALLQEDDRLALAEIGRRVGLAASSVNDRIKRLVQQDIIQGFRAKVAAEPLGLDLLAFMFVGWGDPATEKPFLKRAAASAFVLECHHVTGAWNYLLKIRLANTRMLEQFINDVVKSVPGVQRTETLIVMSTAKETAALPISPTATSRAPGRRELLS
jgi:Lrp/AsnC family leucine-responsive transcriptional regulator